MDCKISGDAYPFNKEEKAGVDTLVIMLLMTGATTIHVIFLRLFTVYTCGDGHSEDNLYLVIYSLFFLFILLLTQPVILLGQKPSILIQ